MKKVNYDLEQQLVLIEPPIQDPYVEVGLLAVKDKSGNITSIQIDIIKYKVRKDGKDIYAPKVTSKVFKLSTLKSESVISYINKLAKIDSICKARLDKFINRVNEYLVSL